MDSIKETLTAMKLQMEEIVVILAGMREVISKQTADAIAERFSKFEAQLKLQNIKIDALNAIDINPTVDAPRPISVKVTGTKKKTDEEVEAPVPDAPKTFSTVTEFFKHIWCENRELVYEKNIYSKEQLAKLMIDEAEKFKVDIKKGNDIILQRKIALTVWRVLEKDQQEIVRAMKNQYSINNSKSASVEVSEE